MDVALDDLVAKNKGAKKPAAAKKGESPAKKAPAAAEKKKPEAPKKAALPGNAMDMSLEDMVKHNQKAKVEAAKAAKAAKLEKQKKEAAAKKAAEVKKQTKQTQQAKAAAQKKGGFSGKGKGAPGSNKGNGKAGKGSKGGKGEDRGGWGKGGGYSSGGWSNNGYGQQHSYGGYQQQSYAAPYSGGYQQHPWAGAPAAGGNDRYEHEFRRGPAAGRGKIVPGRTVEIRNCPHGVRGADLKDAFKEVGEVVYVSDPDASRIAYIVFRSAQAACEAEYQFDGGEINGSKIQISIVKAQM